MTQSSDKPAGTHGESRSRAKYVLFILFIVYVFNFIDRQILSILMESIKQDLNLSDTQLGFLSGIAFALFYVTFGIPIARLADRYSRTLIISVSLAVWSGMTAISGLSQNFTHLLLARIGVGIGEAGASPPAHSLISDYFKPENRATALSVYSLGIPVGLLLGLAAGGWVNDAFGWRMAFFVVGLPGVLLSFVVYFTIKEPVRGGMDGHGPDYIPPEIPAIREIFSILWRMPTFRYLSIASALHAFAGYGVMQWNPAFFIRSHGLSTSEVGLYLGLAIGVSGVLGVLAGGLVADWLAKKDRRWYVWVPGIAMAVSVPFYLGIYLSPTVWGAVLFFFIPNFLANTFQGPAFATVQALAAPRMRAMAAAVFLFIINLVGLGLGPQAVGILSDLLRPAFNEESLRWALCCVVFAKLFAAYYYWRASKTIVADIARVPK